MFTVIIKSKRSSDLLKDYRFLFKPFIDSGALAFCDWNESGTDVKSSVPDLYSLVKGKKEWRAIVLNNDSVYDYSGVLCPDKQNPFDYSSVDTETMPHESPVPIIRLTHMIGGYSSSITKEFSKGFEFVDEETGQKKRVKESELSEDEIHELSEKYCESLVPVYIEKEESAEVSRRYEEMAEKYAFMDIRPAEILLVSTRKKVESNEKSRIVESWKNRLEMTSSAFWERNKYPNNCRFLCYNLTNTDNSMYTRELTEFWLSVLTLSINKIAASTLQAYRLYNIHVDISNEELEKLLNLHMNKMNSVYAFIKEQLKLRPEYSFDEDEELVPRQLVPVAIEKSETRDLYIDFGRVGLSRDCPEDELSFWSSQIKEKKSNLDKYLKTPRRSIDKAANRLKMKTESFTGEHYDLDRFQLSDLKEFMGELDNKIMSSGAAGLTDRKKIFEEAEKIDKSVKKEIDNRLRKKHVIISGIIALLMSFAGFLPYLIQSGKISAENFFAALMLVMGVLAFVAFGGIVALVIQRKHIVSVMNEFNVLMRSAANNVKAYAGRFETYFSDICTYMKAKSILDGIDTKKESEISSYSLMNIHRLALISALKRDAEWVASYDVERVDEMIPTVTSFFNSEIVPKDNSLYYFKANNDENDIPINSTGDFVTSPYKFVEKLWIEREDLFDEEEA